MMAFVSAQYTVEKGRRCCAVVAVLMVAVTSHLAMLRLDYPSRGASSHDYLIRSPRVSCMYNLSRGLKRRESEAPSRRSLSS